MIIVRKGMSSEITIGNPIAADDPALSKQFLWEQVNKQVKRTNCLGDSHGSTKTKELYHHEEQCSTPSNPSEWLFRCKRGLITDEIADLCSNPVGI